MSAIQNKGFLLSLCLLIPFSLLTGCGGERETAAYREKRLQGERMAKIARESGGDWERVSEADRQFLVEDIAHGSEQTARMLILPPDRLKLSPVTQPPAPH